MFLRSSRGTTLYWIVLVLLAHASSACTEGTIEEQAQKDGQRILREAVKAMDTSIYFWGKVHDQEGIPVEGAVVKVHICRFSPFAEWFMEIKGLEAVTDQAGVFEVKNKRGQNVYIKEISKEGYEFRRDANPGNFFSYGDTGGEVVFVPDKNKPVVFRMRKKTETPAFLFKDNDWKPQVKVENSGKMHGYDLIADKRTRQADEDPNDAWGEDCDLLTMATYNEDTGKWNVTFSAGGPNGGIIVSEKILYEAPKDGYQKEWSFIPDDHTFSKTQYLYLKSRTPSIYTRIEITGCSFTTKFVRFIGESYTNPYGDRNLEAAPDVPFDVWKRLQDEARSSLKKGQLPPKHDLEALIKAEEQKSK